MDPAGRLGPAQIDVFAQLSVSTILLGGIYALIAVGLTLIFGIMRVVNFAHGEFLMLGMYLAFWAFTLLSLDPYFVLFVSIPIFFGIGLVTYALVMRGVIHASHNVQISSRSRSPCCCSRSCGGRTPDASCARPPRTSRPRS